jgi:hypothetical protein
MVFLSAVISSSEISVYRSSLMLLKRIYNPILMINADTIMDKNGPMATRTFNGSGGLPWSIDIMPL